MAIRSRTRQVDTSNPALGIDCPSCGLLAARFSPYCGNCGHAFWPNRAVASQAFQIWKAADPVRADARPYDVDLPKDTSPVLVDYQERAHRLGIHLFPGSTYPILICLGFLFLAPAMVPFPSTLRLVFAIVGGLIFLIGVGGWWMVEDIRMYEETERASGAEDHH